MNRLGARVFLLLFLCSQLLLAQSHPPDVRQAAATIDARYNGMKSLRAEFTEVYSGGGVRRSESGTLWIKKPGKMRWEYSSPQKKVFLTDGATAWFYVPGERQARRTPLKKLDDLRSPLRYLLGHTKLEKELRGLSLAPDVQPETAGDMVLRGIPVGMEDRISQVLLESDGLGLLRRIVLKSWMEAGRSSGWRISRRTARSATLSSDFSLRQAWKFCKATS